MSAGDLDVVEGHGLVLPFGDLHALERELDVLGGQLADRLVRRTVVPHDAGHQFECDLLRVVGLLDRLHEIAGLPTPFIAVVGIVDQPGQVPPNGLHQPFDVLSHRRLNASPTRFAPFGDAFQQRSFTPHRRSPPRTPVRRLSRHRAPATCPSRWCCPGASSTRSLRTPYSPAPCGGTARWRARSSSGSTAGCPQSEPASA